MFGTEKQHKLWKRLGPDRAHLYLGFTINFHIYDWDPSPSAPSIMEIAILEDDKTVVPNRTDIPVPEDVKKAFEEFGYQFKTFDQLTTEDKAQLGYEE